jgi:DNA invertase Pin-like site-specific DNA recombinase
MIYGSARVSSDGQSEAAQVAGRARKAVEPGHHQCVAGGELGQHAAKLRPVGLGSAGDLAEHFASPGGAKLAHHARTSEGRARAKANGQSLGRKPKLTDHQRAEAIRRRDAGEALGSIARSYNVSPATISRLTA